MYDQWSTPAHTSHSAPHGVPGLTHHYPISSHWSTIVQPHSAHWGRPRPCEAHCPGGDAPITGVRENELVNDNEEEHVTSGEDRPGCYKHQEITGSGDQV